MKKMKYEENQPQELDDPVPWVCDVQLFTLIISQPELPDHRSQHQQ
jgi:hypothetical protein